MAIKNSFTYDLDIDSVLSEYEDMFSNPNYYKTSNELLDEYLKIFNNPKIFDEFYDLKEMDKLNMLNEALNNKIELENTNTYKKITEGRK